MTGYPRAAHPDLYNTAVVNALTDPWAGSPLCGANYLSRHDNFANATIIELPPIEEEDPGPQYSLVELITPLRKQEMFIDYVRISTIQIGGNSQNAARSLVQNI
jgi:hypothetical protein